MFKTSFNKQFKILSNSVTNFNKTNKNITQLILMSYFNRFRRFSQLYPVNKHTVTYFTRRFDSTNYLLTKKLTKKLQNICDSCSLGLIGIQHPISHLNKVLSKSKFLAITPQDPIP